MSCVSWFEYEYKGFRYTPWDDEEDDNIKTWHEVRYTVDGKDEVAYLPVSPYAKVSYEAFAHWVDTGWIDYYAEMKVAQ